MSTNEHPSGISINISLPACMQAIQPRGKRNVAVSLMLRSMYDKQRPTTSNGEVSEKFLKDMKDTYEFMKSSRLHNVSNPPGLLASANVDTDLNVHGEIFIRNSSFVITHYMT